MCVCVCVCVLFSRRFSCSFLYLFYFILKSLNLIKDFGTEALNRGNKTRDLKAEMKSKMQKAKCKDAESCKFKERKERKKKRQKERKKKRKQKEEK